VGKKKILIVDDNLLIRTITNDLLKSQGYEVIEACDGNECIDKARKELFDLILMDINMPGMSGIEAMKRVNKLEGHEKTPIIALTASI